MRYIHITYPPKNYEYPNCEELYTSIPLPNRTQHSAGSVVFHCQGTHATRSLRSFRTRKPNALAAVTGFARPWAL